MRMVLKIYICCLFFVTGAGKKPNILFFILDDLRPALYCCGDTNAVSPNIDKLAYHGVTFNNSFAQQALCAPSRNSFLTSRRPDTLHLYDFYSYWRSFSGNYTTLPQYFKENGYITLSIGKVFHPGISSNFSDDQPYSWSEDPYHPPTEKYKNAEVCFRKRKPFPQRNIVCPVVTHLQPGGTLPDIESKNRATEFILAYNSSDQPFFLAVGFHKPHIPLKYPISFKTRSKSSAWWTKYRGNGYPPPLLPLPKEAFMTIELASWSLGKTRSMAIVQGVSSEYHPLKNVTLPKFRRRSPDFPDVAWNPWTDIRERDDIKELNISFPFGVIKDDEAKLILQSYYASVTYVDDLIGQILSVLKKRDLNKNTIILLTGDHGWSLGEHGEWSKYSNFDAATRVPLIFTIPGLTGSTDFKDIRRPLMVSEPVELLDIFPTLVDVAGLKSLEKCKYPRKQKLCTEGKSLVPLIMKAKNVKMKSCDTYALSQYPRPSDYPTEHPNSDKPKLKHIKVMGCSLRTNHFRYTEWLSFRNLSIIWNELHAAELYDHRVDPYESENVANRKKYTTVRKILKDILRTKWNSNA